MEELIAVILPDYASWLDGMLAMLGQYLAGGVLVSVMAWAIGYVVYVVFGWLKEWSR